MFISIHSLLLAQVNNVGIGTTTPDSSAALDISAIDKGILIPRMSTAQREMISNPATGLLVFDTDTNTFWYYASSWSKLSTAGVFQEDTNKVFHAGVDTVDFLFGEDTLPVNGQLNTGEMIFFDKSKAAFRAGRISNSPNWNPDSIGLNSIALGHDTRASAIGSVSIGNNSEASGISSVSLGSLAKSSGNSSFAAGNLAKSEGLHSVAIGRFAQANGEYSISLGDNNDALGEGSTAMGTYTIAEGDFSTSLGWNTTAKGNFSTSIGYRSEAGSYNSTAIGRYNLISGTDSVWIDTDPLFEIGNGSSNTNRSNAFTVFKNGVVSFENYTFPDADGSVGQFMQSDGAGAISWTSLPTNNALDIATNILNINNNAANIFNNTSAINTHTSNDADLSSTNELQTLSIVGQDISLSSTNTITLPDDVGAFENNGGVVRNTGATSDDFVFGNSHLPQNGELSTEKLFFFDSSKGAFRSGDLFNSANWATDSLGFNSFATGSNTKAIGTNSLAIGLNTQAEGQQAVAIGLSTVASAIGSYASGISTKSTGNYSTAMGFYTSAEGNASISIGQSTIAHGDNSAAFGEQSQAFRNNSIAMGHASFSLGDNSFSTGNNTRAIYNSVALGRYNVGNGSHATWINTDPLFEIGNGTNNANRNNVLTVLKDGTVSFDHYTFPNADGTNNQIMKTDGSGNLSWVDQPEVGVFENNGGAVRNTGSNTDDFIFGREALPLNGESISEKFFFFDEEKGAFRGGRLYVSDNWSPDSLSENSFAYGFNPSAFGSSSIALGYSVDAIGPHSVAIGYHTTALGHNSIALGNATKAIGKGSTSMGQGTNAEGDYSTALNWFTQALGHYSTSMGYLSTANSFGSLTIGRFNVGSGNDSVWINSDPIFEVGNGINQLNKSNAFTIYKNGIVEVSDSLHTGGNLNVGTGLGARIYLGNTMMQSGGPTILRMDTNVRPFDDDTYDLGSSGKRWNEVWATNGTIQTSDRRLKKDITSLHYGLKEVLELNPIQYHWNKETDEERMHLGLIAQELVQSIPEVVNEEGKYLGVKYAELVPVLIQAIKEQQEIIVNQDNTIQNLQDRNDLFQVNLEHLSRRIEKLELSESKNTMDE